MANERQDEVLKALVESLRQAGLPQAPLIRSAVLPAATREELADRTFVTVVAGVPKPQRVTRGTVRIDLVFDVFMQRAIPTQDDAAGTVRDLDQASAAAMTILERAVMTALYAFPYATLVEGVSSGAPEHAEKGVWTSGLRLTVRGEEQPC